MSGARRIAAFDVTLLAALVLCAVACVVAAALAVGGFYRAWLVAYLFWLGVPFGAVALVLVHDLSGGRWMATARPYLNAAIATMPLATFAGVPAFAGLHSLYRWTDPALHLDNRFYLNEGAFLVRYALDIVVWNLLAAFALLAPRANAAPITPRLSWLSAVGLIALALSASFAAIDGIMSLDPTFWSSVFPMIAGAGWFNTGLAVVLMAVAISAPASGERRDHLADLAAILLATTIFWAYVEFMQFLIIWEEDLSSEIPWYLVRIASAWQPALYVAIACGFCVPFFGLLARPMKKSRVAVAMITGVVLVSRAADMGWLVLGEYRHAGPFWLDLAALLTLGAAMALVFRLALHRNMRWPAPARLSVIDHG